MHVACTLGPNTVNDSPSDQILGLPGIQNHLARRNLALCRSIVSAHGAVWVLDLDATTPKLHLRPFFRWSLQSGEQQAVSSSDEKDATTHHVLADPVDQDSPPIIHTSGQLLFKAELFHGHGAVIANNTNGREASSLKPNFKATVLAASVCFPSQHELCSLRRQTLIEKARAEHGF